MNTLSNKDEETILKEVGERLRELRKKKGFTSQESFAYMSDIPRAQYGRYEKGSNLTLISLARILSKHDITFQDFFEKGFPETEKIMQQKK